MRLKYLVFLAIVAILGSQWYVSHKKVREMERKMNEMVSQKVFDTQAFQKFKEMEGQFFCDVYTVSAYVPSYKNGGYYNAFGKRLMPGLSCASDWNTIPPGSLVYIEGDKGIRVVDDKMGASPSASHPKLDICVSNFEEMQKWGLRRCRVWVLVFQPH